MAKFIKLKHTPIKEIIFTISFKENVDDNILKEFISLPIIKERFPIQNKGFNARVNSSQNNQLPTANVSADGYILQKELPQKKLLQARRGSFSMHLVNDYENFETLIEEFTQYWNLLLNCSGSLSVYFISVRYLNFIEFKEDDTVEQLITINTKHPFGTKIQNAYTQHSFVYDKNPSILINVISLIGKNENKDGIVLDLILNKKIDITNDFSFSSFDDMREAKNDTFFKSVTEFTINRYNQ